MANMAHTESLTLSVEIDTEGKKGKITFETGIGTYA